MINNLSVTEMACCSSEKGGLLDTIETLPTVGWYYGNISVTEAESLLKDEPNGAFLVRDSSDSDSRTDLYTITFKINNRFGSVRVDYAKGYFSLSMQDPGLPLFRTMMDLVSYCYNLSVVNKMPVCVLTGHHHHRNVHLYLTKPVNRRHRVHSLQFLCRKAITDVVTQDKLPMLNLPKRMLDCYMNRNPLFDEQLHSTAEPELEFDRVSEDSRSSGSLDLDTGN